MTHEQPFPELRAQVRALCAALPGRLLARA